MVSLQLLLVAHAALPTNVDTAISAARTAINVVLVAVDTRPAYCGSPTRPAALRTTIQSGVSLHSWRSVVVGFVLSTKDPHPHGQKNCETPTHRNTTRDICERGHVGGSVVGSF